MMLLIILLCFVLEFENAQLAFTVTCGGVKKDCFDNELYSYEKHLILVKRNTIKSKMEITACDSDKSLALKQFDPGRMLQNISSLNIEGVDWSILNNNTSTSTLKHVEMTDMTAFGDWQDCSELDHLIVKKFRNKNITLPTVPQDWLLNCTKMRTLYLRKLNMTEIQQILLSALSVQYLNLQFVQDLHRIVQYPFLSTIRNTNLHLHVDIDSFKLDNLPANLTSADVSSQLLWQVSSLSVEALYLSGLWFDLCARGNFSSVEIVSLKFLYLINTNTAQLCFKKYVILPQLSEIVLDFNGQNSSPGFKLQVGQLFSTPSPQILLNLLNHGQVTSFQFTRDDYLALSDDISNEVPKKSNLTLVGFRQLIKCSCTGGSWWLARAVRAGLVTVPGVMCEGFRSLEDLACEWIDCDRISCNTTCVCCRENLNGISVDCREANVQALSHELLNLPNLTRIIAPKNNITSLPDHLPDNLLWIDLSGNNIWHAGASKIGELFMQPMRRVRLSGNYILCSCDNKPLINTLQNHSHQIEDYAGITCAVTGTKLGDVDVPQLCASRDRDKALIKNRETILIVVMATLVLAAVSLILAFLLYKWRREIQIFLFARGWCLCCITEEDLDADRYYDVFVSFCHEDTEFILKELLPVLDRDYSVCIHIRDWCPGEMIPSQIRSSVHLSRRTLVVMSRNFVRSSWGRLEFQTAHVSGLADGRVRVVMIILDDVLEKDQLAPELRSYVRLNTYVRWDDPWFWEKLRYALPHHRSPQPPIGRFHVGSGPRETQDGHIEMEAIAGPERLQ